MMKNNKKLVITYQGKTMKFDSISQAAEYMNLKQPTVSNWIKYNTMPKGMIIKVESKKMNW